MQRAAARADAIDRSLQAFRLTANVPSRSIRRSRRRPAERRARAELMWPTSLLPITPSGKPTSSPLALSCRVG